VLTHLIAYGSLIIGWSIWTQWPTMAMWNQYGGAFVAAWVLKKTLGHLGFFIVSWAVIQRILHLVSR
jgi:hypothetical protein